MCRLLVFRGLEMKVFVVHAMVAGLLWLPGSPHRQMSGKGEAASILESQRRGALVHNPTPQQGYTEQLIGVSPEGVSL